MKLITTKSLASLLFLTAICTSSISCAKDEEISNKEMADKKIAEGINEEIIDPIKHGETAHENHCYKCHDDGVYTRENRFVKSIDALSKQVVRCKDNTDAPWFDEDSEAVVQFLNNKYYRF
jgi:hypothetical protein